MERTKLVFLLSLLLLTGWNPKKTIYECQEEIRKSGENLEASWAFISEQDGSEEWLLEPLGCRASSIFQPSNEAK